MKDATGRTRGLAVSALAAVALAAIPALGALETPVLLTRAAAGGAAGNNTGEGSVTPNGRFVAYASRAADMEPAGNGGNQVFFQDTRLDTRILLSGNGDGNPANGNSYAALVSANGRTVVFDSAATDLVPEAAGSNRIYVVDTRTGEIEAHPRNAEGEFADAGSSIWGSALSSNGRWLAFYSLAGNLVPDTPPGQTQCYLLDLRTGRVSLLSAGEDGAPGSSSSQYPSLSSNGRFAAFETTAPEFFGLEVLANQQIAVHDVRRGTNVLASTGPEGAPGNNASREPVVSANGKIVAFLSNATDLGPTDGDTRKDAYLRDLRQPQSERISAPGGGGNADGNTQAVSMSASGGYVVFQSRASNILSGVTSDWGGVYLRDRRAGVTVQVDLGSAETLPDGDQYLWPGGLEPTGKWLFFATADNSLAGGDSRGFRQGYVVRVR